MQVRCPRCTKVQAIAEPPSPGELRKERCGDCGTGFKVRGPKAAPGRTISNPGLTQLKRKAVTWQVRKPDGATLAFPNLGLFRKWVSTGVVTMDDEISRSGNIWRKITEIPELLGLFERIATPAGPPPELPPVEPPDLPPPPAQDPAPVPIAAPVAAPVADDPPPEDLPEDAASALDASAAILGGDLPPEPEALPPAEEPESDPAAALPLAGAILSVEPAPEPDPVPAVEDIPDAAGASPAWADFDAAVAESGGESPERENLPEPPSTVDLDPTTKTPDEAAPLSVEDGWVPSMDDLAEFSPARPADLPASEPPAADVPADGDHPDNVMTMQEMRIPADAELSLQDEMDLAGSTLEMKLPDQFEIGRAIEADLAQSASPSPTPGAADHDPFAVTLPEFKLADAVANAAAPVEISMPGAAPAGDAEHQIQAVKATRALVQPKHDPPIGSAETEDFGAPKWLWGVVIAGLILGVGVGGWWLGKSQSDPATGADGTDAEVAAETADGADTAGSTDGGDAPAKPEGAAAKPATAAAGAGAPDQPKPEAIEAPGERVVATPSRRAPLGIEITQVTVAAAKPKKPSKTRPTKPKPEKPEKPEEPKPEKPKPRKAEPSSGDYDGLMAAARQALKSKSTKRALKYLKLAAQLNPRSVEPVAKMGWAYLYMGNATQAILKFQEAKQKNPGYRDTYIGLGKAMERAGRTQDAIRVYQQYLRMCPNCRKAEGVRKSLMRLGAEP